ncbi:phosphonate C-P lyase system protein PhnG [Robbsia sp. KACC 23696]|uniref:phosphonate C-P lyase system protein PhnG n=1 Tax=Robbsia sp. KACC 23696 TaxID=3149231 RepID=UPI00325B5A1D
MNDESSGFSFTAGATADAGVGRQTAAPPRAAWMRDLALADTRALDLAMTLLKQHGALPAFRTIRAPETGMAMVRGRSGGSGAPFNLGEMTITRCALALEGGELGLAYVQGRDRRHAEQAAYADALLQTDAWHTPTTQTVLAPLRRARAEQAAARAADNAASRVDFFTLARGDADDDLDDDDERQPTSDTPEHDNHDD